LVLVLAAIDFDDQSCCYANEIRDVRRYRILAPELEPIQPAISQQSPQPDFGVGLIMSKRSCAAGHFPSP
jgi:hypothetical protein